MKKILIILIIILFGFTSFSQKKEDNTIIIKVQTEAKKTYDDLIKHMVLNGFTFDQKDEELLYFVTGLKAPPCGKPNYRIKAFIQDAQISITVEYQYYSWEMVGPLVWKQWFYKKGGVMMDVYKGFYPILESFNSNISLIKK